MLSCYDATKLASAQLDRTLGFSERLSLYFHLFICPKCKRFINHMKTMHQALGQWSNIKKPIK